MILSIVSGTYNRIQALQRMIQSVREQMPEHIPYEFVIVDGGSTDGSLDWCRQQSDIVLIEQGALLGAIRAFCDGARAARGEYVVMANDDITFHPLSLVRAIAHLESHPECGAVAFADNRTAQIHDHITGYRVESMGAITADGFETAVSYAQVGMFRRALGDKAGWWGVDDPIMGNARTYGGDNYLSARIWEMGYSVDPVDGCAIEDHIVRDELRDTNGQQGSSDSAAFYARYPNGPQLAPRPQVEITTPDRLRILYLPVHEVRDDLYDLGDALANVGLVYELDYLHTPYDLPAIVRAWKPDLMLTQIQMPGELNGDVLRRCRHEKPDMVIVNWNGDAHEHGLISDEMLGILHEVDLQTCINAAVFDVYRHEGIPHAYWQIGYKAYEGTLPQTARYDVLFQGNCYNEVRDTLVASLKRLPARVGIYGNCKGSNGYSHYDWAKRKALHVNAKIVIGDTFDPANTRGFVSNRMMQALGDGAFFMQQASRDLEALTGFRDGVHYVMWQDFADLHDKVLYYLQHDDERRAIMEAGQRFVLEHYTFDAQVRKLFTELLPQAVRDVA